MKTSNLFFLTAALVSPCVGLSLATAQELFKAEVNTRSVETNGTGGLSYGHYGNRQIIAQAAADAGITNLSGLHVVYNKTADDLEVVMGTNNTVIAAPITFSGGVSLSKTNGTVMERLSWVFLGTNTVAAGTLRATEYSHFGTSNQLTQFTLIGQLQFAAPATGTNGATIYAGSVSAGSFGRGDQDGDRDDDVEGHR